MKVYKRWGAAALLSLTLWSGAYAAAATSVEMLRDMFRTPITEWKQQLKANSRLLNEEFFSNVDKRVRWGIENNHVDDAFRFAMVGDFAAEAVNRPANYRIDLAELFFKAENAQMCGQIIDNIMISSPGTPPADRAQFLRGRLFENAKDLFNAYQMYKGLADKNWEPAQTWLKCGQISFFIGETKRAEEELTIAAKAGSPEAQNLLANIQQQNGSDFSGIAPIPNSPNDTTTAPNLSNVPAPVAPVNTTTAAVVAPTVAPPAASTPAQKLAQARLLTQAGKLDDAVDIYETIFDPSDAEVSKLYGAVLYRSGALPQAKAVYDQALAKNGKDVELLRGRANTLERMYDREGQRDNLKAALADYRSASALAPDNEFLSWEITRAQAKN